MTQNDQSYEQLYSQNQLHQQQESDYQNQLMLDENDQIQLYKNHKQITNHKQNLNQQIYEEKENSFLMEQPQQSNFIPNKKIHLNQEDSETHQVNEFLKTKYGRFNQQILIKMLYDSFFPSTTQIIPQPNKISQQETSKIQTSNQIQKTDQRKDIQLIKRLNRTVKIFVEHGYGINIARQYAAKGQNIQPNPYNNTIGRVIKETWKSIEIQMLRVKKSLKPLPLQKFNQIKTPLLHAKNWMEKKYLDIFNHIISYIHGLKTQKPSLKNYQDFYNYMIQKAKNKKNSSEKGFYKKKNKIESKEDYQSSSEQFKPVKKQKFSEEKYKHLTKLVKNSFNK